MNENKTVVIIGAGVAGIATSVFLAKKGYKVKVYEKNPSPGGRCSHLSLEGHRFDLGASIFLMPDIYRKVFAAMGLDLDKTLETTPLTDIYTLYFGDGTRFSFTTDRERMKEQLEAIEPGSYKQFQTYVSRGYGFFKVALTELLGRNYYNIFQFITFRNLAVLLKVKTYLSHMFYISRFFKDRHLKIAFTFQNIYVGQNPLTAPALFAMLPAAELSEGSLYPKGGMYGIVDKLLETARGLGVEFFCDAPVVRIETDKNRATGITLEDGTYIPADIVVANADLPYVYRALLPGRCHTAHLERLKYSCSAISFHWALDKQYPQPGLHGVFMSLNYEGNLNTIFRDKSVTADPSFYLYSPVTIDPSAAPEGHDSLSVVVPAGHIHRKNEKEWAQIKQMVRAGVIARLKKEGMEDIEEHIKFEICYLPKTWETGVNVVRGSVFGSISHNIFQMGFFRPHNRHARYKNLYFAGGSTNPGNGVPLVLMSAQLTTERIEKEMSK